MRKALILLVSAILFLSLSSVCVYAHSGKTDGAGGHYDSQDGEYHYHHGYPAHSHTNGICPYDYDDKTDHSSNNIESNQSNNKTSSKKKDRETSIGDVILQIINALLEGVVIFFMLGFVFVLVCEIFFSNISDKASIVIAIFIGILSIILAITTDFIF